jgi:ribosomal protein S18 acetylase RimI-like enzyme
VTRRHARVSVRNTEPPDFDDIIALTRRVYPDSPPWSPEQLASHLRVFPEGQFVAKREGHPGLAGMAASLIVRWDDYEVTASFRDFTAGGTFTNHDPVHGRTLYGAEVMVDPAIQRSGVGAALYRARRDLAVRLGLLRIRAAARLRGYHRYAHRMSAEDYVARVVRHEIKGPTLSFQLREGFEVIQVVPGYLKADPESLGYAAVIEWINPALAHERDREGHDPRFRRPSHPPGRAPDR